MRICYLSHEYPPETCWSGIGTYIENMAVRMARLGQEVHVVCRANRSESSRLQDGVWVHRVAQTALRTPGFGKALGGSLPQAAPYLLWSLAAAKKAREIAPEVVEAPEHRGDGFFWSLRHGKGLIVKLHAPMSLGDRHNGRRLRRRDLRLISWLERESTRRAGRVLSVSAYLGQLVERAWRLRRSPEVVPCPVDLERHHPVSGADRKPDIENGGTVLFVGRLERLKGIDVLVSAFAQIADKYPGWRLRLVGTRGEEAAWLGEHSRSMNGRIEIAGRLEGEALVRAYQEADIVVVPSRWDNTPNVCLEAMAHGRVLAASRCGGIPEIVREGVEGLLVEPGNATQLAAALERLMKDPELRAEMGRAGSARAESRFSLDRVARQMLEVYEAARLRAQGESRMERR
jgi:glycosyltransferase involved in cell wall biosynthesis